ncbi:MAG: hypothetical protein LKG27_04740 [Clostridiaceae bacterium]|jgi:hypothetical protein|nr:hypothetical protein [Clostridiaceae bacterium]
MEDNEKKIMDMEDLMIDYGEMTSFDFNSLNYKEMLELQKIVNPDYANQMYTFKYGNFDMLDLIRSFMSQKETN